MPAKKYITWAAAAFVAFYVITQPDSAARSVDTAASGISSAADSLATFVNSLA
ncbi:MULTISPECIES: hypothetical protein [unclassified Actinomadura]|uniref:hypothetical protein n=1 Tax=unclassified Actinomadura TaxID=2626254 RepID=UPI00190F48F5|nr:hypothetical protein [Actinomadura sp. K4S16]